jgi:hypothetical protein
MDGGDNNDDKNKYQKLLFSSGLLVSPLGRGLSPRSRSRIAQGNEEKQGIL